MSDPEPDKIRPIYCGKVDKPRMYINGKKVSTEIFETYHGVFDCETGILHKYENGGNDNAQNIY